MVLEIGNGCFKIVLLTGHNSVTCLETFKRKRPSAGIERPSVI